MSHNKIESVSTIIASFPIPELSKLGDTTTRPTYHSLLTVQKELNTNAASIDTTQGTGIHGLLVLTMSPDEFATMINPDDLQGDDAPTHPAPPNPGALNVNHNVAEARNHVEALYHFQQYHSTDKALRKQLTTACPNLYLSALMHPRTGLANVTTLQMLTHLWATYGEITPDDLDANDKTMSTPWHPTTPIENLYKQIDDGLEYALAGNSPITDIAAVRIIYKLVHDTGLFELPCRDWRAKPNNEKTLANFKTFFTKANNDRAATTSSVGYHQNTANAIITTNDTIAQLLASHNKLQEKIDKLSKQNTNASKTTSNKDNTNTTRPPPTFKGYCHTHGTTLVYKESKIHNSKTCRNPGPDHKSEATEDNKMGGNTKVWEPAKPPTA
jgi:hypothetical protein